MKLNHINESIYKYNQRYHVYISKDGLILDESFQVLKPWINWKSNTGRSYYCLTLYDFYQHKFNRVFVHRLVAYCWCDGYERGKVVDHIDNDPLNYHPSNLQWVTQSENIRKNPRGKSKKNQD